MMAGLEAAWALAENTDDPVVLKKAREKARLCGQMAVTARRIVLMVPKRPVSPPAAGVPAGVADEPRPERGIDRLKGGRRGRL